MVCLISIWLCYVLVLLLWLLCIYIYIYIYIGMCIIIIIIIKLYCLPTSVVSVREAMASFEAEVELGVCCTPMNVRYGMTTETTRVIVVDEVESSSLERACDRLTWFYIRIQKYVTEQHRVFTAIFWINKLIWINLCVDNGKRFRPGHCFRCHFITARN